MRNVCFFWNTTHIDRAQLTASSEVGGWPVANLQNPMISRAWKCADSGGNVRVSFDIPRMVTALVLVGHNLGVGAKVRLISYSDNFQNEVFRQQTEVIKPVYSAGELLPCNSSPLGYPSEDDLAIMPRTNVVMMLDQPQCYRNFKVEIESEHAFHLGRLLLCEHFEPQDNFSYGWKDDSGDDSILKQSLGGQDYADPRHFRYAFSFSLDNLSEGEVFGPLLKMRSHCKTVNPLVVSLTPDNFVSGRYTSIHCKFAPVPKVTQVGFNKYSAKINLREVL